MPLSEYEQRVLAQMEQQLRAADPELASSLQHTTGPRFDIKRLSVGFLGLVIGIGILVSGVSLNQMLLGVLGFIVMASGGLYAVGGITTGTTAAPKAPQKSTSDFMKRQQEKWDKRSHE